MTRYDVKGDGNSWPKSALIGTIWGDELKGWRFYPRIGNHKPSRKSWDTPEASIPAWVGSYTLNPNNDA